MKKSVLVLTLIGLITSNLFAQSIDESALGKITKLVKKEAKGLKNGGIVLTMSDANGPFWSTASGYKENEILLTADTRLLVASVTKLFTATAVMQLVEEGKVDLNEPVSVYLPGFELRGAQPEDITLGSILTHHSALPSVFLKGYSTAWDGKSSQMDYLDDFLKFLKDETAASDSHKVYRYSNLGYELAAAVVSKVSGMEFYDYIRQNIVSPMRMENSTMNPYDLAEEIRGYVDGEYVPAPPFRGTGEGDLISTTNDLGRFAAAFLSGGRFQGKQILKEETVTLMLEKHNRNIPLDFDLHRGYGWYAMDVPGYSGVRTYYHDGGTNPFSSTVVIIPEYDIALTILANEDEKGIDGLAGKVLEIVLAEKNGGKKDYPFKKLPKTPTLNEKYYGNYATELGLIRITGSTLGPKLQMMGMALRVVRLRGGRYGIRLKILGLLPLPIADLNAIEIRFDEIDSKRIFGIYQNRKFRGIGTRFETPEMHPLWQNRIGEYVLLNPDPTPFMENFALIIDEESTLPMVSVKVVPFPETLNLAVDMSRPDSAVVIGYGRYMGDRIDVLTKDGDEVLRYSGHFLKKKN
jgi:CubicO group peptidase (beta-lactamase class C family)